MIACILHLDRDSEFLPGFLAHIRDYVDTIYVSAHTLCESTTAALIDDPQISLFLHPASTDKDTIYAELLHTAERDGHQWVLFGSPTERFETNFLLHLRALTAVEQTVYSLHFRYCWEQANQYRKDGLWGRQNKCALMPLDSTYTFSAEMLTVSEICEPGVLLPYSVYELALLSDASSIPSPPFLDHQASGSTAPFLQPILIANAFSFTSLPQTYRCVSQQNVLMNRRCVNSVLMTSLYFCSYSGSELHIFSMAQQFISLGYEVTIAVFYLSQPLLEQARKNGIHVIDAFRTPLPRKHYDVFFAQHFAVSEFVVLNNEFSFSHLIVSKLSLLEPMEALPSFYEQADVILCNSQRAKDQLPLYMDALPSIYVFPNYADASYFEAFEEARVFSLNKIAVISNHVVEELIALKDLAKAHHIQVDLYGAGHTVRLVTPDLLTEYDLVISIGKTVQFCMAMGIPVYCYDHFGGPGFLTPENIDLAQARNFSGKGFEVRKSAQDLLSDIVSNYQQASSYRSVWHDRAEQCFSLEKNFHAFIGTLCVHHSNTEILKSSFSHESMLRSQAASREIATSGLLYHIQHAQVYYDTGSGLSEEQSILIPILTDPTITISLDLPEPAEFVRFDPCMSPCICHLSVCYVNGVSAMESTVPISPHQRRGDDIFFFTDDPSFRIQLQDSPIYQISLTFSVRLLSPQQIGKEFQRLQEDCAKYQQELSASQAQCAQLEQAITSMQNSTSWKLTSPLRKIRKENQ